MKHLKLTAALTALCCTAGILAGCPKADVGIPAAAASAVQVHNPIIWADVPDVDVIRVGDTYYMVSTTMFFSPGAPIMKSKDLFSWEICSYVYDTYADGDVQTLSNGKHDYAHGQWATSLRYHDGKYYVFFGSYGSGKSYIYQTDDIENGKWTRSEINGMYHDASILFDDDGRNYLVYGGGGEIQIKELNAQMTGFKDGGVSKTLFKTGLDGLAGEGSHIQKIGDYYYVFVIAWPSGSGRIELCYRSKELLGNYEGKTVLNSGVGTYGSGAAQGGIVDTPDGQWYGMVFQDHGAVGRIPVLVPVTWEDGFPMMGVNGKAPVTMEFDGDYAGTYLACDDDFSYSSNNLKLEWQWNHNPDNNAWSVTERDGWLRLHNEHLATNLLNARNTLTMRTEGPSCSGVIKLDTSNMKPGDYAGLSAFQLNYGNVGVYVADDGSRRVYMAKNGGNEVANSSNKIIEETPMNGKEIYLKAEYNFNTVDGSFNVSNNIDKANFYYSYDGSSWTKIGDTLGMTYDLKLFTGYRNAIYSYATKSTGGYADIDFFDYERGEWNEAVIAEPDPDGYFFHSTYEGTQGADSWTGRGSAKPAVSSKQAYLGSNSLYVSGREASWNGAIRSLSTRAFTPGAAFSFSAHVYFDEGPAFDTFHLTFQYEDADGETHYEKVDTKTIVKGQWVQLANQDFTIPAGASNLYLYVETDSSTTSFYMDEMIGAPRGTVIAGETGGSFLLGDVNADGRIDSSDLALAKQGVQKGKFASAIAEAAADVDQSGDVTKDDLVWIQQFVLGKATAYPEKAVVTPPPSAFNYDSALQYHDMPAGYKSACAQTGKIEKVTTGATTANVYLPYGYDSSKQYNIFYLMHGGGENQDTIFSDDVKFNLILDNMIMNGDIEPMIVVTPTFNDCGAEDFHKQFVENVVKSVESKYSTYAKSTSDADLRASRMHRAYGGFSMGGLTTWYTFMNCLDYVGYFMPLSGDNWAGNSSDEKAAVTADAAKQKGYSNREYFIFAATGTEDIAYTALSGQCQSMKKLTDQFVYTSDFSKGNFYFLECPGATHWWGAVVHYIYDGLPYFFHET